MKQLDDSVWYVIKWNKISFAITANKDINQPKAVRRLNENIDEDIQGGNEDIYKSRTRKKPTGKQNIIG